MSTVCWGIGCWQDGYDTGGALCQALAGGGGGEGSLHQLFTSVFIEGNVINNAWWGVAGPFESPSGCS